MVDCHRSRQPDHSGLGRRVGRKPGASYEAVLRAHVDDCAAPGPADERNGGPAHQEDPRQVDADDRRPRLERSGHDISGEAADPGHVDCCIQPSAQLLHRRRGRFLHLVPGSNIGPHRHCGVAFVAEPVHLLVERVRLTIEAGDAPAGTNQQPADSSADPRSGPGNQHVLALNF